ncbi:CTSL [Mytilus coruscus]|uniref:CTSL n=1 Tax=Mytilus coruscus TaxID=42192 RepID=A0A6J8A0P5_MYTCO|nr:CTSL [Mytilus coruscus]
MFLVNRRVIREDNVHFIEHHNMAADRGEHGYWLGINHFADMVGNGGCNGGFVFRAYQYVKDNNGIDTESSYPYEARNASCRFQKSDVGATVTGIKIIKKGDEQALKSAVATVGLISVAIDADRKFHLYKNGVFDEPGCNTTFTDHAVLIVGYGVENGQDYWLVKNSWSESWGIDGYIKMSRNKDNQEASWDENSKKLQNEVADEIIFDISMYWKTLAGSLVFTPTDLDNEWDLFKTSYNKMYADNVEDLNR